MNAQNTQEHLLMNITLLRFPDLLERQIVRNRITLNRWIKAGKFPAPIRLGTNTVAWRLVDVERWLDERSNGVSAARGA